MILNVFSCAIFFLHIIGEMPFLVFCLCSTWIFFFLLLRFENSLHILDISSSSDTWFTNNVLLVCSLSFHPPNRSFAEKKFLILVKYNVSVFPFIDCAFDVKSKNTLPSTRSQRFSLIHFPKVL